MLAGANDETSNAATPLGNAAIDMGIGHAQEEISCAHPFVRAGNRGLATANDATRSRYDTDSR